MELKEIFSLCQRPLIVLANNKLGRKYLGIDKVTDKEIIGVHPNGFTWWNGLEHKKGVWHRHRASVFNIENKIADKLRFAIRPGLAIYKAYRYMKEFHYLDRYLPLLYNFGLLKPGFLPLMLGDVSAFNVHSTGSGYVPRDAAENWATTRDATQGSHVHQDIISAETDKGAGATYAIYRAFMTSDTSSLDDGATINGGTVQLFRYGAMGTADTPSLAICGNTQATNTQLGSADYDALDATDNATRITFASLGSSVYTDVVLNATGEAAIIKTGYTKFSIRTDRDADNVAPTVGANYFTSTPGTHATPTRFQVDWSLAGVAGAAFDLNRMW